MKSTQKIRSDFSRNIKMEKIKDQFIDRRV